MIDWLKFTKDLMLISIRNAWLVQFIRVLLSHTETLHSELTAYFEKSKLYASCNWQTCWLEYLLRKELQDDSIEITEGDGLPFDFVVTCANYAKRTLLKGLINRYKMAGRSYRVIYLDLTSIAEWSNAICEETNELTSIAEWSNAVCEQGVYAVMDASGTIFTEIRYDQYGVIITPYDTYIALKYFGSTVTVSWIAAYEDGVSVAHSGTCNLQLGETLETNLRELVIYVTEMPSNTTRSWVYRFESEGNAVDLTISQEIINT